MDNAEKQVTIQVVVSLNMNMLQLAECSNSAKNEPMTVF